VRHSKRTDSFCEEDEHFFGSYEANLVNAEESPRLEFDTVEARPPSAEQLAHFTRFRKPVAWVVAAMGSLSLVALVRGFQQNSRGEVVTHTISRTAISAATRTAAAPWSSSEFAEGESPLALVLQPTRSSTSNSELPLLDHPATQASLVNDFTSALLSMCRAAPA
jgi:hypothetical protein